MLHRIIGLWNGVRAFDNRWQLVFERVLCRQTTLQVYRKGPFQAVVNNAAADAGSIRTCISSGMYRRFLDRIPTETIHNVLDIGANVGGFSLLLMCSKIKIRNLVCVELNPNTFDRLRFNIMTNIGLCDEAARAEVVNAGLYSESGQVNLYCGLGSTGDSIDDLKREITSGRGRLVRCATLAEVADGLFGNEVIDLCKMDIEGSEEQVILRCDSSEHVFRRMRFLIIEIHHQRSVDEVINRLRSFGLERVAGEDDGSLLGVSLFVNKCAISVVCNHSQVAHGVAMEQGSH